MIAYFPLLCSLCFGGQAGPAVASGQVYVGWSAREITPARPVALSGQFHKRISTRVEAPLWATALALEVRDGEQVVDQAILVSCDLVGIMDTLQPRLRERIKGKIEGFDHRKLLLNATHTTPARSRASFGTR